MTLIYWEILIISYLIVKYSQSITNTIFFFIREYNSYIFIFFISLIITYSASVAF